VNLWDVAEAEEMTEQSNGSGTGKLEVECPPMQVIDRTTRNRGTAWLISVLLLSLPSLVFVIMHALYAPGTLPEFFDLVVVWTVTVAGMTGALLTVAAFVVSVIATFQKRVPRTAKVAMWVCVSLSFLGCLYLARTPP
jgi:hypothetical protein